MNEPEIKPERVMFNIATVDGLRAMDGQEVHFPDVPELTFYVHQTFGELEEDEVITWDVTEDRTGQRFQGKNNLAFSKEEAVWRAEQRIKSMGANYFRTKVKSMPTKK